MIAEWKIWCGIENVWCLEWKKIEWLKKSIEERSKVNKTEGNKRKNMLFLMLLII